MFSQTPDAKVSKSVEGEGERERRKERKEKLVKSNNKMLSSFILNH